MVINILIAFFFPCVFDFLVGDRNLFMEEVRHEYTNSEVNRKETIEGLAKGASSPSGLQAFKTSLSL